MLFPAVGKREAKGTQERIWHCKVLLNSIEATAVIRCWYFRYSVSAQTGLWRDLGSAEVILGYRGIMEEMRWKLSLLWTKFLP